MNNEPLLARGNEEAAPQVAAANPFLDVPSVSQPALTFQEHHLPQVSAPQRVPSAASLPTGPTYAEPSAFPPPPPLIPYNTGPSYASTSAPSSKAAPGTGGFFSVNRYQPYFNVDTSDVFARIRLATVPIGSSFYRAVADNPDLYGPFWICATLVFVSAATGNAASYLSFRQFAAASAANGALSYTTDITKVSVSAAVFFSYIVLWPLMVWGTLKYWGVPSSLIALIALYGYALFIFIPISILSVIPIDAVRWPLNLAGGLVSMTCLVFNLRAVMADVADAKKRTILLGVAGVSQLGLAILMKLYCFSYRPAVVTTIVTP